MSKRKLGKLGRVEILGESHSLADILEGYRDIEEDVCKNQEALRRAFEEAIPYLSYNPEKVCVRPVLDPKNDSYFILVMNTGRESRPHKKKNDKSCPLCLNLIKAGLVVTEFGEFYLAPNGYPYHKNCFLLISKNTKKSQDTPSLEDIEQFMKFSSLTGYCVFYNTFGAGATIEHEHAQIVDPSILVSDGEALKYPLFQKDFDREKIDENSERIIGYSIDAVSFHGEEAPARAFEFSRKAVRKERKYNFIIKNGEFIFIERCKEYAACTERRIGAYETLGVFPIDSFKLFHQLNYKRLETALKRACSRLDELLI